MNRKDLKLAAYNPREMDDDARARLHKNVEGVGLLEPIVMNETTGNVLSGHQRIDVLDVLEGTQDYLLDVSVVKMTLEQEQAQNIFLNNELAMGDFDAEKLGVMLPDIDLGMTGFTLPELETIVPNFERPKSAPPAKTPELANAVVLVFKDRAQNDAFMELLHLSTFEKYISGETLAELVQLANAG